MTTRNGSYIGTGWLCLLLVFPVVSSAQQKPNELRSSAYSSAMEVNLVGTVSSFEANSQTGPLGAHVIVRAATGTVDVHVGNAKFLEASGLTLNSGDSVRIIGESFTNGANTVFLARIIQKGTLAVAVRSPQGMPLWPAARRIAHAKSRAGAL